MRLAFNLLDIAAPRIGNKHQSEQRGQESSSQTALGPTRPRRRCARPYGTSVHREQQIDSRRRLPKLCQICDRVTTREVKHQGSFERSLNRHHSWHFRRGLQELTTLRNPFTQSQSPHASTASMTQPPNSSKRQRNVDVRSQRLVCRYLMLGENEIGNR
jgi:hypothetical protein